MLKRATSIAEMLTVMSNFATGEGVGRGLAYKPQSTDVFITPYPKCGTTWTQQIVHGLRTRGSMDFSEITEVVPWLELAHDMNMDVDAPQIASPRAFKSHLGWDDIPKGGRYINVYRDPSDALVSMYRFFEGWVFETGTISLDEFATEYFLVRDGSQNYWQHAASWWRQGSRENVLLLCFEQMRQDLPDTVRRIANFINCPLDDELHELAVRQSGIEFMKQHAHQFDDHLIRESRDEACGLPTGGNSSKVRQGISGEGNQLSSDTAGAMDRKWEDTMAREFGLDSYRQLLEACHA